MVFLVWERKITLLGYVLSGWCCLRQVRKKLLRSSNMSAEHLGLEWFRLFPLGLKRLWRL